MTTDYFAFAKSLARAQARHDAATPPEEYVGDDEWCLECKGLGCRTCRYRGVRGETKDERDQARTEMRNPERS